MMSLNSNLEVESRLMLKSMIALGKKKKKDLFFGNVLGDNERRKTQEKQYAVKADSFLMEYFPIFP